MYANISLFHFRIKSKYLILRKCLFCDFLQIVLKRSRVLHVHRRVYLSTPGGENYLRCQSLFVCKHCLVLRTRLPTDTKVSHGCCEIEGVTVQLPDVKIFCISIK